MNKLITNKSLLLILVFVLTFGFCAKGFADEEEPEVEVFNLELERESIILASLVGVYGVYYLSDSYNHHVTAYDYGRENLKKSDVNWLDRGLMRKYSGTIGTVSDVLCGAVIALPVIFFFDDELSVVATNFVMYAETLLLSLGVKDISKTSTRYRPYAYFDSTPDSKLQDSDSAKSFFSSHTSSTFTAASFLTFYYSRMFPDGDGKYWIGAAAFGGAAATGALRIAAGRHFLTDVIAGAAWGTFIGYLIPKLHEVKPHEKDNAVSFSILPTEQGAVSFKICY
jgi:hypothetical protein